MIEGPGIYILDDMDSNAAFDDEEGEIEKLNVVGSRGQLQHFDSVIYDPALVHSGDNDAAVEELVNKAAADNTGNKGNGAANQAASEWNKMQATTEAANKPSYDGVDSYDRDPSMTSGMQ